MCQKILTFCFGVFFLVGITMPEVTTKFPSEDCGILEAIFLSSVFSRGKKGDSTEISVVGNAVRRRQIGWLYSYFGGAISSIAPQESKPDLCL
jgi:hypothetical protein